MDAPPGGVSRWNAPCKSARHRDQQLFTLSMVVQRVRFSMGPAVYFIVALTSTLQHCDYSLNDNVIHLRKSIAGIIIEIQIGIAIEIKIENSRNSNLFNFDFDSDFDPEKCSSEALMAMLTALAYMR
jgi:hypothetical protein